MMKDTARTAKRTLASTVALSSMISMAVLIGCGGDGQQRERADSRTGGTVKLASDAFADGGRIPKKYTAEGEDVSPPLEWSRLPAGTKQLALIMDDPDAPAKTWVHLVLYGINAATNGLKDSLLRASDENGEAPAGMTFGKNSWSGARYRGPAPPPGKPHRYYFRLYALDASLKLQPGLTKRQLLRKIEGHVLATGTLMGTYSR